MYLALINHNIWCDYKCFPASLCAHRLCWLHLQVPRMILENGLQVRCKTKPALAALQEDFGVRPQSEITLYLRHSREGQGQKGGWDQLGETKQISLNTHTSFYSDGLEMCLQTKEL